MSGLYAWRNSAAEHMVVLREGEYLTPPKVAAMGMWVCYTCGEVNILETNVCKHCLDNRFFIILNADTMNPSTLQSDLELKLKAVFQDREFTPRIVATEAVRLADYRMENYHVASVVWHFCKVVHSMELTRDKANAHVDEAMAALKYAIKS